MEENKFEIPKQLESLLGQPPLLEGEDREAYFALRAALIEDRQPKTVMDWIHVHDLVTQLWEEQRFRRASAALIRGGMLAAIEYSTCSKFLGAFRNFTLGGRLCNISAPARKRGGKSSLC